MSVSPPRPKGPPLNALRAFEAAARLGGFANAADELCVTPGAVSQHVRSLEDWLGASLFERRSQGVRLTQLGADVAADLTGAFDKLGAAVQAMRGKSAQSVVHIAALPSVAQLWLSPRLPGIRAALPEISISVSAVEVPPNMAREMFDISLFIRRPRGAAQATMLAEDKLFPVCAPDVAEGLQQPADLAGAPLLHDATWAQDWQQWAGAVLPGQAGFDRGAQYSLYSIALEEARNGAGVLMGHECLVEMALARGELIAPFERRVSTGRALVMETAGTGMSAAARAVARALSRD